MADFGGMGGSSELLSLDETDLFAMAVERALGERIRADDEMAKAMWSALANVDWKHTNGDTAGYSFRAAGDLIASIRRAGNYMDWYCSGPYATVDEGIADALGREGWSVLSVN
jgi:hypothetical protein